MADDRFGSVCSSSLAVDTLGIDGIVAGGSPLALEERGDPPVSIGRPVSTRRRISAVSSASPARVCSLNLIGTRHPEGLCDPFQRVSSGGCDRREFY
jgi:hypothetical protein